MVLSAICSGIKFSKPYPWTRVIGGVTLVYIGRSYIPGFVEVLLVLLGIRMLMHPESFGGEGYKRGMRAVKTIAWLLIVIDALAIVGAITERIHGP